MKIPATTAATGKIKKSYFRTILIGSAIFTVIVLHFAVSQFIAVESDKNSSLSELINEPPVVVAPAKLATQKAEATKTEAEEVKTKINDTAESIAAVDRRETDAAPRQKQIVAKPADAKVINIKQPVVIRKKEPVTASETRAERLRRAEKILTGV